MATGLLRPDAGTARVHGIDVWRDPVAAKRAVKQVAAGVPSFREAAAQAYTEHKGGWKNVGDVEIAVAEYVDWFNHRRLHGEIGLVPPAEFEANQWATNVITDYVDTPVPTGAGSK